MMWKNTMDHVLTPGACEYVAFHGKGTSDGLRLKTSDGEIILGYGVGCW